MTPITNTDPRTSTDTPRVPPTEGSSCDAQEQGQGRAQETRVETEEERRAQKRREGIERLRREWESYQHMKWLQTLLLLIFYLCLKMCALNVTRETASYDEAERSLEYFASDHVVLY